VTATHPARTGPALTEAVDPVAGVVRVSGHLTVQGADLVRGTVENLCRLGHSRVVLDLAAVQTADDGALPVLQALRDSSAQGRVVLLGAG
jgi:anti-anti-sigma regulatory factor